MKSALLVLLLTVSIGWACEGCDEGFLTVYDNSTPEARHRTQLIDLITVLINTKDQLNPQVLAQLVNTSVYVLRASEHNEQRLIVLEEFVNDHMRLVDRDNLVDHQ